MQIVWTDFAISELNKVHQYYSEYAGIKVAQMITHEIINNVDQLILHLESGSLEPKLAKLNQSHRYLLSGNIKIIYKMIENKLVITDIFDCRQNPNKISRSKNAKENNAIQIPNFYSPLLRLRYSYSTITKK